MYVFYSKKNSISANRVFQSATYTKKPHQMHWLKWDLWILQVHLQIH